MGLCSTCDMNSSLVWILELRFAYLWHHQRAVCLWRTIVKLYFIDVLNIGEVTAVYRNDNTLFPAGTCSDRITSQSQWRTFANSLASEGLVVELAEQQQLQKLWDRAVLGANSFGRMCVPPPLSNFRYHCCTAEYWPCRRPDIRQSPGETL